MPEGAGTFEGTVNVYPQLKIPITNRCIGTFQLDSVNATELRVSSKHPNAEELFHGDEFLQGLEHLSWDLIWERQAAIEFELIENTTTTTIGTDGCQLIEYKNVDRLLKKQENRTTSVRQFTNFDLLQRIRDHLISSHLITVSTDRGDGFLNDAALLLAVEHYIKGIIIERHALAEFYSVVETIENQVGGRSILYKWMTKSKINKITQVANTKEYDQRHAPRDPSLMKPLPTNAIVEAALVAKGIIVEFAKRCVGHFNES